MQGFKWVIFWSKCGISLIYRAPNFFQELFGLKSEENEKLAVDLKDTLKQLEDKSAVLMQTQEEKEASIIGVMN